MGEGLALPLPVQEEAWLDSSARRLAVPERLLNLAELDVLYDDAARAIWTFMRPYGRPSFTPPMLGDFELWQDLIGRHFGPGRLPLDYLILGSRSPGVFCFGGDLDLFQKLIRAGDRNSLAHYGYRCVEILHRNMLAMDLPMLTIGLVQGQALGGGFEALLSFDVIIAERGSTFGLPEVMFGLFPGMGAHAILSRKLGTAMADRIILSQKTYTAEEMYEMGIVAHLAEPGEGVAAVRDFIAKSARRHSGMVAAKKAMRVAAPLEVDELRRIVDIWADAALQLSESDLRLMTRLAGAQARNHGKAA
ncbi:enoyl-CoA hydratase [Novosphingobium sp. FSY-8]|uniref:Enoyl-CoA hydratase n=2 Tax=Novosphingobium ovatum TaxID=1908523 RepID=A0ABW9XC04_9SPHN|nr:enoyl-CoA hydratase [Novosphingobium ovatum]